MAKALPSKRGFFLRRLRLKIGQIAKEKGEKVQGNGNLSRSTAGVGQGLVPTSALGGISISEALMALSNEPEESKNLPFSESTKGVYFT